MAESNTKDFYDNLAANYHLIFADWRKSVSWHGEVLDRIIRKEKGSPPLSVLDCSCGIGTQAIGLALRGYEVRGSDLSPGAIIRARKEAKSFGVSIKFSTADFRTLAKQVKGLFDVVISGDNSLPHLLTEDDLLLAVRNIYARLKSNGLFLASIRDYDAILKEKLKATQPQVFSGPEGKRIVFQVWDWSDNDRSYIFHLFIMGEIEGKWNVTEYTSRYKAILRSELSNILQQVGFKNIHWLMPEESGYYQPVVVATK